MEERDINTGCEVIKMFKIMISSMRVGDETGQETQHHPPVMTGQTRGHTQDMVASVYISDSDFRGKTTLEIITEMRIYSTHTPKC